MGRYPSHFLRRFQRGNACRELLPRFASCIIISFNESRTLWSKSLYMAMP